MVIRVGGKLTKPRASSIAIGLLLASLMYVPMVPSSLAFIGTDDDGDGFIADDPDDNDPCNPDPNSSACHPVGGEILPIDMTSLFIAGAFSNAYWILPTLAGIAGALIAMTRVVSRKVRQ